MSADGPSRRGRWRRIAAAVGKPALLLLLCAAASAISLETVYRLALFDPYRGELREYNPRETLEEESSRPTLLVLGDSVTAGRGGYVDLIREARPDLRVINGGIPGSFVLQTNLIAKRRFERFKPSLVIYQVNVGNDLLNARYPVSWGKLSPARNLYWTFVHRLRFLEYGNYKLGQLVRSRAAARLGVVAPLQPDPEACRHGFETFDPEGYTERVRRYIRAEPGLYENQALLRPERHDDFERLAEGLDELLAYCESPGCRAMLLVVPHASQVDEGYQRTLGRLGARFDEPERLLADESPFTSGLRERMSGGGHAELPVLDARAALRQAEREGIRTYFLHDPHLNFCGQQTLATVVLSNLP